MDRQERLGDGSDAASGHAPARVLIVPAGTEIGLEARECLANSKYWKVVGANSVRDHSEVVYSELAIGLPFVDNAAFAPSVIQLVGDQQIDFVVPAHDDAVFSLAGIDLGRAKWAGPDRQTADILRFKSKTYALLKGHVPCPEVFGPAEAPPSALPLFVKPDRGQGSRGARRISTVTELDEVSAAASGLLVSEFLPGPEFTVDCYTDAAGFLRYASARRRDRIRDGICVRADEVDPAPFRVFAEAINSRLVLRGPWFFQMKTAADGVLKLLEVANRVSGTMGFQRERGINLLEAWLHELSGRTIEFMPWTFGDVVYDRSLAARAKWSFAVRTVYVDFDDTLVLPGGKLNYRLVGNLYGLKANLSARIILITRHAGQIEDVLSGLGLRGLFDQVHHLKAGEPKSQCIDPEGAVFIDDSFSERREVWKRWGIPTFPIESLALLEGLNHSALG